VGGVTARQRAGQSEVADTDMAVAAEQQVTWLKVAVDDPRPVCILDGIGGFCHPTQSLHDRRAVLPGEVAALDEVHHQEVPAIG